MNAGQNRRTVGEPIRRASVGSEPTARRALKVPEALPTEGVKESAFDRIKSAVFRKKTAIQSIVREPTSGGIVFRFTKDRKDIEILLIQDSKERWTIPKGHIEPGETPEDAIVREIHEELEATIAVDSLVTVVDYDYETFHLHMHCFLCHVSNGVFELHEHMAARWLDASSIDTVEWLPADEQVVDAIKNQGILPAGE